MSIMSKVIYKFNVVSIKIPVIFFTEREENNSKIHTEQQKHQIAKAILSKKCKLESITLLDLQTISQSCGNQHSMVLANVVHQRILGAARLSFYSGNLINKLPICFLLPYFIFICFYSLYYQCYFSCEPCYLSYQCSDFFFGCLSINMKIPVWSSGWQRFDSVEVIVYSLMKVFLFQQLQFSIQQSLELQCQETKNS